MNILRLRLDDIEVGDRLREVDGDYALLIAASMDEHGQMTPIEVRATPDASRPYALISGAHRMAALHLASIATAEAIEYSGSDLQVRLREIDENLIRHELTQLDRSIFLAERKVIWEQLHPETRHGGARTEQVANFAARRFTTEAAERLGFSERAIRLAVTRHNRLHPDVRRRLTGTWLADHGAQLDVLAKAVPSEQLRAVALLFGDLAEGARRPGSVGEALNAVLGIQAPAADPDAAAFDAFLRLWKRMPAGAKRRVRAHVNEKGPA